MIRTILSSGRYVTVSGGTSAPYINSYGNGIGAGNMRFNTQTQCTEVCDGNNWISMASGSVSVGLNGDAEALLDWARTKRDEEYRIAALAAKHPTVADALAAVQLAQDQLKVVTLLCDTTTK